MRRQMKGIDGIHVVAGMFILVSPWVHGDWYYVTAFVGLNLFQFGSSGFCPLGFILKKRGVAE
ncbi:MAG: DUF2892 domain-containing protein [Thermodesulfobacteriota bacterium]|nr:DUF2892 domain-containing protein [Thermodesulfobacteriota bacterium]